MIQIKRAYDPPEVSDGRRILVDRLWPRGLKKETLHLSAWAREVAPSNELRKWFGHDPARWAEFRRRYFAELRDLADLLQPLFADVRHGKTTLLFSAHDAEHNNAVALKEFLERQVAKDAGGGVERKGAKS